MRHAQVVSVTCPSHAGAMRSWNAAAARGSEEPGQSLQEPSPPASRHPKPETLDPKASETINLKP